MATIPADARSIDRDDGFFLIMAIVMALIIVSGFSLQFAMGRSSFAAPLMLHLHAFVFMGWTAFYVLQNALVATGSVAMHRRLGWVGAGWAAVVVLLGVYTTAAAVRRGTSPFFFEPGYFLVMNSLSVIAFGGLTAAAIVLRRRNAWHRRLMVCGMALLTGPAFGRILPMPLLIPWAAWAVFAAVVILPLVGMVVDARRWGRVHPAWLWGLGVIASTQIAMDVVARSSAGLAIYHAVVAGGSGEDVPPLAFPPPPSGPLITGR